MSDFRSVQVGYSRFSRRCHLISVLCFSLYEGSLGPGTSRSHLNSAVELSCSVTTLFSARFLYAAAVIAFWVLRNGSYTSPLTHSRCSSTASFRATATTARFLAIFPPRSESFRPQRRKSLSSPNGPKISAPLVPAASANTHLPLC